MNRQKTPPKSITELALCEFLTCKCRQVKNSMCKGSVRKMVVSCSIKSFLKPFLACHLKTVSFFGFSGLHNICRPVLFHYPAEEYGYSSRQGRHPERIFYVPEHEGTLSISILGRFNGYGLHNRPASLIYGTNMSHADESSSK